MRPGDDEYMYGKPLKDLADVVADYGRCVKIEVDRDKVRLSDDSLTLSHDDVMMDPDDADYLGHLLIQAAERARQW